MNVRFDFLPRTLIFVIASLVLLSSPPSISQPNVKRAKQGYSMRLSFDNRGVFGRVSYPGVIGGSDPGRDSMGLEYPLGQPYEHLYGGSIWVGGKLDTARFGTSTPIVAVTTGYEGWAGPYFEFFPGSTPADTIWKVNGRGVQRPQGWDAYWGDAIPRVSISDNDHYCSYSDTSVRVNQHVPLRLKIVQSTFAWNDLYAETIQIIVYKVMNMGFKRIDSVYVAFFLDGSVGPYGVQLYYRNNYSAYYPAIRTAYIHNPIDFGSTPVGVALLGASRPLDSLRVAFKWYAGPGIPGADMERYALMTSGVIQLDQYPSISETMCYLSCGPFILRPCTEPAPDTLIIAFALLSGQSLNALQQNAARARTIYLNGGLPVSVRQAGSDIPERFELLQNYPNPFNTTTNIGYRISDFGFVSLGVFDMLGRQVATLVNEVLKPGSYETTCDASGLASGVYFYRLQVGDYKETKRLVLLR